MSDRWSHVRIDFVVCIPLHLSGGDDCPKDFRQVLQLMTAPAISFVIAGFRKISTRVGRRIVSQLTFNSLKSLAADQVHLLSRPGRRRIAFKKDCQGRRAV
jgi:hypothetical protein